MIDWQQTRRVNEYTRPSFVIVVLAVVGVAVALVGAWL